MKKMSRYIAMILLISLIQPVLAEEGAKNASADSSADENATNSWQQLTSWFRIKKNPYRTSSSDIVARGRRNPFAPPSVFMDDAETIDNKSRLKDVHFFAAKERELILIQEAYDKDNHIKVVMLAKPFLKELGRFSAGPEHDSRQQELIRTVKNWRNTSREKIETQGMLQLAKNLVAMQKAFTEDDYEALDLLSVEIKSFVKDWDFSEIDRQRVAEAQLTKAMEMLRRGKLREEFSKISIKITFRIISGDLNVPSTATINGKSLSEGSALDTNLLVKKISETSILFEFKGELIEYDIE